MKKLLFLMPILVVTAFQCEEDNQTGTQDTKLNQIISSEAGGLTNDPFMLKSAEIVDDFLRIEVQYSGGCEDHAFTLVWPEVMTMIYPPSFGIELYHDDNGDMCKALPLETLEFDLTVNPISMSVSDLKAATLKVINASNREEVADVQ